LPVRHLAFATLALAACSANPPPAVDPAPPPPASAPAPHAKGGDAVLLFASRIPGIDAARFEPILCVLGGKLQTGIPCGEAMPANARVSTRKNGTLAVSRSTKPFVDEARERPFAPPRGPSCCMYNGCRGETVPYFAASGVSVPERSFAFWPENAVLDFVEGTDLPRDAAADGPWQKDPERVLAQGVRAGGRRIAAVGEKKCRSCGTLWLDEGSGWRRVAIPPGLDGFEVLATTDLDGDGAREAVILDVWRNDFGLRVLGNDWKEPALAFSCGNL
jgi:hypothetical protein